METIPFLLFPDVVKQMVLAKVSLQDQIDFSTISERSKKLVRHFIRTPCGMDIDMSPGKCTIMLLKKGSPVFRWSFDSFAIERPLEMFNHRFNNVGFFSQRTPELYFVRSVATQPDQIVSAVISHVAKTFTSFSIRNVQLQVADTKEFRQTLSLIGKCETFNFDHRHSNRRQIPKNQLKFLLENIKATRNFKLSGRCNKYFRHNWRPNCEYVSVMDSEWITGPNFLNMKFARIHLKWSSLREKEMIRFIRLWMSSNDTRLRSMEIHTGQPMKLRKFREALPIMPRDFHRRRQWYRLVLGTYVDCIIGLDIERHDGLLATIVVHEQNFYFFVWHDWFPVEISGREV